jgi:uncharacterized membrane protein (DUF373 family)
LNNQSDDRIDRVLIAGLEAVEHLIYAVIAVFLIAAAGMLLAGAAFDVARTFDFNNFHQIVVNALDAVLLVFVVAELLHTVRVTLRDRALTAEPFLVVGLIAGVRRILILTASNGTIHNGPDFVAYWVEFVLLIFLVIAMVAALFVWRRVVPAGHRD